MPRSKRDKKVSLTKTDRKGLAWKQRIIDDIRFCVEKYPNIFVFQVQNMRNNLLKDLRQEWKRNSRFIFGKNRIMQIGLGRTEAEEVETGIHKLSKRLNGQVGLLFTEKTKEEVLKWAENYWAVEYARSGFTATETVTLPAGPLEEFAHSMEPHLRSLGLPTKLEKGIVTIYSDYTVCEEGKVLTPEQARILKLLGKPMAKFRLTMKCSWTKADGFQLHVEDDVEEDENKATDSPMEEEEGDDADEDIDEE
ncbi:mRNA turnover protein 4 homolog [Drosophila hydei]|uniref:Ribosome assembly factor mrt4 n=1 Tax=Drosophila hydei TaxID=7224 RepID=A0A6J2SUC3_DROHY|nr:mRNA turnover protein 4 homolog [Drosophila hydei]XP_030081408.1 mRNA turnover protein 4 homolog [Drosophila hydei]